MQILKAMQPCKTPVVCQTTHPKTELSGDVEPSGRYQSVLTIKTAW